MWDIYSPELHIQTLGNPSLSLNTHPTCPLRTPLPLVRSYIPSSLLQDLGFKVWPLTSAHPPSIPSFPKLGNCISVPWSWLLQPPPSENSHFLCFYLIFPPLIYVGNPYSANVSWMVRKAWPFHRSHLLSFSNSQCEEARNQDLRIPWVNAETQSSKQKHKGNYCFKSTKNGNTFF